MKQVTIAMLSLLVLGAMSTRIQAQVDNIADPFGSIYLSSSPTEYNGLMPPIQPSVPFPFYLVVEVDFAGVGQPDQNSENGVLAWEAMVTLPPDIFIVGNTILPATSVNIGSGLNYIVGAGPDFPLAESTPFAVVNLVGLVTVEATALGVGTIGESDPPSFPGQANWVEFLDANGCSIDGLPTRCLFPFAFQGELLFSPVVPTESQSWGTLKSDFGLE